MLRFVEHLPVLSGLRSKSRARKYSANMYVLAKPLAESHDVELFATFLNR